MGGKIQQQQPAEVTGMGSLKDVEGVSDSLTAESCYLYTVRATHRESLLAAEGKWLCGPATFQNLCFFRNFNQG